MTRTLVLLALALLIVPASRAESPDDAKLRHAIVAERRAGVGIHCHRGSCEVAHENTLEAYRATFELGGDGNEIDIRKTKDGVLVVFHDDMLDRLLEAYGDVSDYSWQELQRFRFRNPGWIGNRCRIATLAEVFELHRRYAGLLHLDIKVPGIDNAIADLLTRIDMWDHVAHCNTEHGGVILKDARYKPRKYKAPGLFEDRSEVFPDAIAIALKKPGDDLIADYRRIAVALGGSSGSCPSTFTSGPATLGDRTADLAARIAALKADDWNKVAESAADRNPSASGPGPDAEELLGQSVVEEAYAPWRNGFGSGVCTRSGCTTASTARRPCAR